MRISDWSSDVCSSDLFTLRLSNSGFSFATSPSSVVQTGVKSLGCENSTAHLSPIQSWNLIGPSVDSCVKSGAVSPSLTAMAPFLSCFPWYADAEASQRPITTWRQVPQAACARQAATDRLCCDGKRVV